MRLLSKQNEGVKDEIACFLGEAQQGDLEAREFLIKKYTPFILKVISKQCGRYIHIGEDDEVSIGLIAFNEAINYYKPRKNGSFLSFAELVIKRRLVDYYRKEKKDNRVVFFSNNKEDEDSEVNFPQSTLEGQTAVEFYSKEEESKARKEEIVAYNQVLAKFGLSFKELVEVSPKHQDARISAIQVAKLIANDQRLREIVLSKKTLPLKEIEKLVNISRKTLERQRKYIIAVFLILVFEFSYLKEYIKYI